MRTIFHLDLDAFFVSVERILDPSLEGKPVVVGGDPQGRGVVAACSYEARKYGLHSGMPIRQAFRLCPHGIYLHGHHGEYSHFSNAVRKIIESYAPQFEQASIDEFYIDFTGCGKMYGNFTGLASELQYKIWNKLSLPCSVGIGSNKTIAKIASDCNKPKGITHVIPGMEKEFLRKMPVEAIPGVGKVTHQVLRSKGIYRIGDIARLPENYFTTAFGKHGADLWKKANGGGTEYLSPPQERKSISKERTFKTDIVDRNKIETMLFNLTGKVCQLLRDNNWQASTVSIKLRYSDFKTLTRARSLQPTDDDKTIYETALKLFRNAYTRRVGIRLIGVHLTGFNEYSEQETLFREEKVERKKMLRAVNRIRDRYGYEAIKMGAKQEGK